MNLLLNGQQTDTWNMVLLTGVPCILTAQGSAETGTKAKGLFGFRDLSPLTAGKTYTIYINGHPLTSTPNQSEAGGTRFYLPTTDSLRNRVAAANSVMRAAMNVPELASDYSFRMYWDYENENIFDGFYMEANGYGPAFTIAITHDMPQTVVDWNLDSGSTTAELTAGSENILYVDIYRYNTPARMGSYPVASDTSYITTLSRKVSTPTADFDLAPVLESTTEYGVFSEYRFVVYLMQDGFCNSDGVLDGIYATKGYMVNQGLGWYPRTRLVELLQNVSRGKETGYANNTVLYTYFSSIPLTLTTPAEAGTQVPVTVRYLASDYSVIGTSTFSSWPSSSITDAEFSLDANFTRASFVELATPSGATYLYKVTKPVRAVDEADCQRIKWRNEYGGISFFDFTGGKTETRKVDTETYDKSHYTYHTDAKRSLSVTYDKQVKVTVQLTTHWVEKDALWILYSLQNSREAWTEVNNVVYDITVTDIKVTESSNNAGVFKATCTYTYSLADTL